MRSLLNNMSLVQKQILAFGLIVVIMIGVNVYSLIRMSSLKNDIDEVTNYRLPSVTTISEINDDASHFRITELQHAFTDIEDNKKELEKKMEDLKMNIQQNQKEYEELLHNEEESKIYNSVVEKWEEYLKLNKSFLAFSYNEMGSSAILYQQGDQAIKLFDDFSAELKKLVEINRGATLDAADRANTTYRQAWSIIITLLFGTGLLSILIVFILVRAITIPVQQLEKAAESVANGDHSVILNINSRDEIGNLADSFNRMTRSIREATQQNKLKDWLKSGQNELNEQMRGDQNIIALAKNVITYLCKYLKSQVGALYLWNEDKQELQLTASYAFTNRKSLNNKVKLGEGIVGQAALEKQTISISNIPKDYIRISSALGDTPPRNIVAAPFLFEDKLSGVIEFGSVNTFTKQELEFLKSVVENIAIGFNTAQSSNKIRYLLQESQRQAAELQKQQAELKASNEELEAQTIALRESEARLQQQQEELRTSNEELEEKTQYLEQQKAEITQKNVELQEARNDIEQKAKELEINSKYKSEFLANMSHELRTPLNSLLILAKNLTENKNQNLSQDQVEAANIIFKSGNDLLNLINDILDLSKIEAGRMTLNIEEIRIKDIATGIIKTFKHMTDEKRLELQTKVHEGLPAVISTDMQKVEQILKNLMSNAIKFTTEGAIIVDFYSPEPDVDLSRSGLMPSDAIAIAVTDSGIGISEDKQLAIFEAFQQADGSTSRKYGGTGLGLSISKELAKMLGGELHLISEEGKGSTFTCYIPINFSPPTNKESTPETPLFTAQDKQLFAKQQTAIERKTHNPKMFHHNIEDDRNSMQDSDRSILIIEDDLQFAKILLTQCHQKNFKALVAATGEEGLELAERFTPNAIILDIRLPGINGWAVLDMLKDNPALRHIPVHLMSAEEATLDAYQKGAIGFLTKPVTKEDMESAFTKLETVVEKKIKDLLVVEDNETLRQNIVELIGEQDVHIVEAASGREAIDAFAQKMFDCMVLDLGLPDMSGFELLNRLSKDDTIAIPPVIVYTGKEISKEEHEQLMRYSDSIIIKGIKSEERLLDESALFLHRIVGNMPKEKQQVIANLHNRDSFFQDKKILLVDDDMRNVFALSKILQEKGIKVIKAEDGNKALRLLEDSDGVDLVLMDIMMPVMDGYEAMRHIRQMPQYKKLPIIALTAKAMKEDREKCIEAGASDYLTKPVDVERLLSAMRVWLYD